MNMRSLPWTTEPLSCSELSAVCNCSVNCSNFKEVVDKCSFSLELNLYFKIIIKEEIIQMKSTKAVPTQALSVNTYY